MTNDDSTAAAFGRVAAFAAVLFALPTLFYPLGADQSLFAYVGRRVLAGQLPYIDVVDIKPPLVFFVYAIASALGRVFASDSLAVRSLDIATALALSWIVCGLARGGRPALGLAMLTTLGLYYGAFDYWCVGQVEIFQSTCAAAALLVALRTRGFVRAAALAGALTAASLALKPSLLFLPPLLALFWRARSSGATRTETTKAVAAFGALSLFWCAAMLLPFAARAGGLSRMREVLIEYQSIYIADNAARSFSTNWDRTGRFVEGFLLLLGFALVRALRTRDLALLRALGLAVTLTGLAAVNVFAQRKFLDYHWAVLTPFVALAVVVASSAIEPLWARYGAIALWIVVGIFPIDLQEPTVTANYHHSYGRHLASTAAALVRGEAPSLDLHQGGFGNDVGPLVRASAVIRALQAPGDTLCARSFRPLPYSLTGLVCPSRFPWEQHTATDWNARALDAAQSDADVRVRWAREHRAALTAHPPKFVLTFPDWIGDRERLAHDGYEEIFRERDVSLWRAK